MMTDDQIVKMLRNVCLFCMVILFGYEGYTLYTAPKPTVENQRKWAAEAQAKKDINAIDDAQWLTNNLIYVHDTAHDVCYSMYAPGDVIRSYTYVPCTVSVKWIDISPDNP